MENCMINPPEVDRFPYVDEDVDDVCQNCGAAFGQVCEENCGGAK